jgi:tetratricopeptide (TPR) repeat protein
MILGTEGFIRDDRWLLAGNRLLRLGLEAVPRLLTSGYWESVAGAAAPVQEYRPLLSLSFLLHFMTSGALKWPMHAANILLHALVCCLFLENARRRIGWSAGLAAALLFAVLPVHVEAVSYITSRSELLVAASLLGAWLALDPAAGPYTPARRMFLGAALFWAGLLSKEHAILFPLLLALSDWTFHGLKPWSSGRLRTHALLALCAAAYLGLRWLLLAHVIHGGTPYFSGTGRWVALLTMSNFAWRHYFWPSLSGIGLCADYSRPLVPDAGIHSWTAWLGLSAWALLSAAALRGLYRREPWAFWVLAPAAFLLPTCNLIFPLDTIGAERFLYIPSMGLAALLGLAVARLQSRDRTAAHLLLTGALVWYALAAAARGRVWLSEPAYYAAAVACNPASVRSRCALGTALIEKGEVAKGEAMLLGALAQDPLYPKTYFNLARLAWDRGDAAKAESLARQALALGPHDCAARVLLALCLERRGRLAESAARLEEVLTAVPWDSEALFNLGRIRLMTGQADAARPLFARFARLAPDDPAAAQARALAEGRSPAP